MRTLLRSLSIGLILAGCARAQAATTQPLRPNILLDGGQVMLPSGWKISPAGRATKLPGDMPMRMLFAPDRRYLLVSMGGYNDHGVSLLDGATGKIVDNQQVPRTFVGMCLDRANERVLLSGGQTADMKTMSERSPDKRGPAVRVFRLRGGKLAEEKSLDIAGLDWKNAFIGGLAYHGGNHSLYAADVNQDCVYRVDPGDGRMIATARVGYRPCAVALSEDGKTLAVANWGGQSVSLLDPETMKELSRVAVESHPSDLLWTPDGRLFVTNAGANTVSVLDQRPAHKKDSVPIKKGTESFFAVTEVIRTSLHAKAPIGSTPIALAAAGDRLYVANADNNDVAVVDIEERGDSKVIGFIPTGWYPSAVAASKDAKRLYIGTAKGMAFGPNNQNKRSPQEMLTGHVSIVDVPDEKALSTYTRQVLQNTPVPTDPATLTPDQRRVYDQTFGKIKYVLYIIKENRTYDQVFGDIAEGNGDPRVVMFGQKVTPNQHKMARQWVLLDNLYCNGEVSQDGHVWCDGAYASDYTTKAWENHYSQRGQPDADDRLERSPGGYIWDQAIARGLSFRTYGERERFVSSPETAPQVKDDRMRKEWVAADWSAAEAKGARDYELAEIFIRDLREAEKSGNWPNLITMSLNENHTHALTPGAHTPEACVGSNDLALGRIVEAVTHSKFWPQTAIFVIEDDAQNGHDHVDAHRTVGLVISPYTRRGVVDSTMYTQASYLRTMELMLKLPPMTQYDAAATPMINSFMTAADPRPYDAVPVTIDLAAKNPEKGEGAKASLELDFSEIDAANAQAAKFNTILWNHFHPGESEPPPVRSMVLVR
jgi:YVTN family beta-propeller protein